MTKADWLEFFEAINGRSATEEEIAAALAAGEFQDDAPAVETAPTQEAPAQPQPTFASAQEAQPQPTFAGAQRSATTADFWRVHKTRQRKLLLQMLRQPKHNQPLAGAQAAPVQGVPNQAAQPQAGFRQSSAGQQALC